MKMCDLNREDKDFIITVMKIERDTIPNSPVGDILKETFNDIIDKLKGDEKWKDYRLQNVGIFGFIKIVRSAKK